MRHGRKRIEEKKRGVSCARTARSSASTGEAQGLLLAHIALDALVGHAHGIDAACLHESPRTFQECNVIGEKATTTA